jgi:hypothetical protein
MFVCVCVCVCVCVYVELPRAQVSDGSVGAWPTLQGGGWKNSQTAALRLLLCFAMGLEFVGGIDVEPALMGTHFSKVLLIVILYSRCSRAQLDKCTSPRTRLPHSEVV